MKLKSDNYGTVREYGSLEEYAEYRLDGDDYGKGAMEAATDTARNNSRAIGRLLDHLAEKGLLNAAEVSNIVEGWSGNNEFVR